MSDTAELVERLRKLDIRLALDGERLGVDAPKGAMTAELREELGRRKDEVLDWLRANGGTTARAARTDLAIGRVARGGPLPVSFMQERLWFFHRLEPGNVTYNMHFGWRLRGALDVQALEGALGDVVGRHEMLRTSFGEEGGRVYQVVHPPEPFALPIVPLQGGEAEAFRQLEREALKPFALERDRPLRATLLRQSSDDHWLLVVYHHIAGDGWSSELFARELAELYTARVAGRAPNVAPLPIQYADYAHWLRSSFAQGRLAETLAYWTRQLDGAPMVLELPLDRPRPALQVYEGAVCMRTLDAGLRERLVALSRAERNTLFVTLVTAFNVVLGRLAGQSDLCVGMPVAGRDRTELEALIGVFINTVVMRMRLTPGATFRDLLVQEQEAFMGAMAHRDAPFGEVAKALAPERDLSRSPVFQVLVNMLNFPVGAPTRFEGLAIEPVPLWAFGQLQSKFDLTMYLRDDSTGLLLSAVYNPTLFDAMRIEHLLDQYEHMLRAVVAAPEAPVMQVSLVTPAARALLPDPSQPLVAEWTEPVHARFRRHAAAAPDHPAVIDAQGTWSYATLDRASGQLAGHLAAHGIGREDVVAVYAERNVGLAWAMLGIHKAGAGFLLLDPAHPEARAAHCLRAARPKAFVRCDEGGELPGAIEDALREVGPLALAQWPAGSGPEGAWSRVEEPPPEVRTDPDQLAYVAFTSGSTGLPKGIVGTHRPLSHFFAWHEGNAALTRADRFSALSGIAHDPLLRDVLGAFWVGATVCMPDALRMDEPGYLGRWLAEQATTVCHLTPAMAQLVAIDPDGAPAALPALRHAFFGGDVLRGDTVALLRRQAPQARIANFYGATETPQIMAWHPLPADDASIPARVPIGRGIDASIQILVLNAAGALAGIGELGEIHVRTPYLARGYLDDAVLTAERFLPGPGGAGDRMYRTGDLGRYRPDGSVEPAGRADQQVKIRGFRVELGEVEAILGSHPAIARGLVLSREAAVGDARLVAYVVYRPGEELTVSEVRRHLRRQLPDAMVPSVIVALEAIPLTPNGKVDRAALPDPFRNMQRTTAPQEPPAPGFEERLAAIWCDVLAIDAVGAHDNFFELGGQSLLALQVASRVEAETGWRMDPRSMFFQSLRQVAAAGPGFPGDNASR